MKIMTTFLVSVMAVCGFSASALVPNFTTPHRIDISGEVYHPVLSPDGSTLLFSSADHTGLNSLDLATGKISVIDKSAAAGFEPTFSHDGSKIYYRTAVKVNGLMNRDVRCFDVKSATMTEIAKPNRDSRALKGIDRQTYAATDFDHINVSVDGKLSSLDPVAGAHTYQWASISPDGTRLLFSEPFKGVFVCNLDGTDLKPVLPKGDYPCWIDDSTVAAVVSHDDGYIVLDSAVVLVDLASGGTATATTPDYLVGELTASPANRSIIFTTVEGELYQINPTNTER